MKRRIPEFIERLSNYLQSFYKNTSSDGWMSLWGSLIGAVIGAAIALFVVYIQNQQQKSRDQEQQITNEQNKLKYLHFLIVDSFKTVTMFAYATAEFRKSFDRNPFVIPSFGSYPAHSLNAIATKINQEDYYLASLNLLESDKVGEVFLLCNTLYEDYRKVTEHSREEFPKMIERKDAFKNSLKELSENVNQYTIKHKGSKISIHQQVEVLQKNTAQIYNSILISNDQLKESNEKYLIPLIQSLESSDTEEDRKLFYQARSVNENYLGCIGHLANVVADKERSSEFMKDMARKITDVARPLHDYVTTLESKNK